MLLLWWAAPLAFTSPQGCAWPAALLITPSSRACSASSALTHGLAHGLRLRRECRAALEARARPAAVSEAQIVMSERPQPQRWPRFSPRVTLPRLPPFPTPAALQRWSLPPWILPPRSLPRWIRLLPRAYTLFFPLWTLIAAYIGLTFPAAASALGSPVAFRTAIAVLMLSMGLTLTPAQVETPELFLFESI